ncbi:hypothetical protein HBB16_08180 [Pseudonocardia sp. MCCB 268]|nr:hypothetical protein [Pseudonocardia cytotoxica]
MLAEPPGTRPEGWRPSSTGWTGETGDASCNLDFLLPHDSTPIAAARRAPVEHREFVDTLLERYGYPSSPTGNAPRSSPSRRNGAPWCPAARECGSSRRGTSDRLYASALGAPPPGSSPPPTKRGAIIGGAGRVGTACRAAKGRGVDFVVAAGTEAGGHCSEIATMVLTPDVVDVMGSTPVLAAGGIGTDRPDGGNALTLGAQGVDGVDLAEHPRGETHPVVLDRCSRAGAGGDAVRSRAKTPVSSPRHPSSLGLDRRRIGPIRPARHSVCPTSSG